MLEWKTDVDCRLLGHNRMRLTRSHCGWKKKRNQCSSKIAYVEKGQKCAWSIHTAGKRTNQCSKKNRSRLSSAWMEQNALDALTLWQIGKIQCSNDASGLCSVYCNIFTIRNIFNLFRTFKIIVVVATSLDRSSLSLDIKDIMKNIEMYIIDQVLMLLTSSKTIISTTIDQVTVIEDERRDPRKVMLWHDLDLISFTDRKKMKDNLILLIYDESSIRAVFCYHEDSRIVKNDCITYRSFFFTVLIHSYVMISLSGMRRHIRPLIKRKVIY